MQICRKFCAPAYNSLDNYISNGRCLVIFYYNYAFMPPTFSELWGGGYRFGLVRLRVKLLGAFVTRNLNFYTWHEHQK